MTIDVLRYLGKRYERDALGPDAFDCFTLALRVQRDLGHAIEPPAGYAYGTIPPEEWFRLWRAVEPCDVREGDVLVVPGYPRGVGTVVGADARRVLTITPAAGVVVVRRSAFESGGVVSRWRAAS